jgi:DnaJ-class molecular chaperone
VGEVTTPLPPLEVPCPHCGGQGLHKDPELWARCGWCDGRGRLATDDGERLLDFISSRLLTRENVVRVLAGD